MKKIFITLGFVLIALSMGAQNSISYSAEFVVGVGVGKGPLATLTPQFIAQYDFWGGLRVGGGIGIRYAMPCNQYLSKNKTHDRNFSNEIDIPLFFRFGYDMGNFYANIDAGYAIGVLAFDGLGSVPGGLKESSYDGVFVEPQIGWRFGERRALAIGLLWQQSNLDNHIRTESGIMGTPSYSVSESVKNEDLLTPAITLRYTIDF